MTDDVPMTATEARAREAAWRAELGRRIDRIADGVGADHREDRIREAWARFRVTPCLPISVYVPRDWPPRVVGAVEGVEIRVLEGAEAIAVYDRRTRVEGGMQITEIYCEDVILETRSKPYGQF